MNLAEISIRRPVAAAMVVVGVLLLGLVSLEKIPLNLLPDITYPKITIRTEYPNASPREVEERVTKLIESYVGIINNVVKVSSVSRSGWSYVYVEFRWGSDIDVISMDIREKLQLIENFLPEDVEKPVLLRYDPNQDPIITLAVSGDLDLTDLRRWAEMNLEMDLERIDGVAAVKVEGGYQDEVVVELDEKKLAAYGITISEVAEKLRRENLNIAGGFIEEGGNKIAVRTMNRFQTLEDINEIIVAEKGEQSEAALAPTLPQVSLPAGIGAGLSFGSFSGGLSSIFARFETGASRKSSALSEARKAPIRVKDLGEVRFGKKERTEIARLNGKECIKVSVFKEGDANIVTVARRIHRALSALKERYRAEPRSPEWERKLKDPRRKLKAALNALCNLLLNYKPFYLEPEPVKLAHDINIETVSDQSVFISQAIYSVAQTAIWGALIAVFVLYVFLRNLSSTFIVGMAIPISIVATFNLMFFKNITFNIMSLGGLALGVGMLVDNSIVVLENILRRRTFEPDPKTSAQRGAGEVASAITASTITNIMVFFPILYLEGMFRQIFGDLAWTVAMSLICSEAVALSIVPMLSVVMGKRVRLPKEMLDEMDLPAGKTSDEGNPDEGKEDQPDHPSEEGASGRPRGTLLRYRNFKEARLSLLEEKPKTKAARIKSFLIYLWFLPALITAFLFKRLAGAGAGLASMLMSPFLRLFDSGFSRLKRFYPQLLRSLIKRPALVSGLAILIAGGSLAVVYFIGWELLPSVDQGEFFIKVKLPAGTPIEKTNEKIAGLERKIQNAAGSEIHSLFATVGVAAAEEESAGEKAENIGEVHVSLVPRAAREETDDQIIAKTMKALSREVELEARSAKPRLLSYRTPVEVEIEGYDLEMLKQAADLVAARLKVIPGLADVESSMAEQNPEINIVIDREKAAALGVSVTTITDTIQKKIKGQIPTRFDLPDQQIDIVVQLREEDRESLEQLGRLTVPGPGGMIRLDQVAQIKTGYGPASITRSDNRRVALVTANLLGRPLGDAVRDIKESLAAAGLPAGVLFRITGQNEEWERSKPSLYLAGALAVLLVYLVLAAQFESLVHPFVIMFCVPFSMVGLSVILLLTGQTINIFSLIGMLMMIGIAVNDAIVLVTTINLRRDEGMEKLDAVVEASRSRLRPILITTLTTVLGMVPMAVAFGPGSELRAPMAITVIGGLVSSTIFTLTAIPCLYLVFDRILPRSYTPHPIDEGGEYPLPGSGEQTQAMRGPARDKSQEKPGEEEK